MLRTLRQRITITDIIIWIIGLFIAGVVIIGSIRTLELGRYTTAGWLDLAVKGLALGGVYALIAMGYTMVYGILKMINFAHSEVFMSGPFTAVFVALALSSSGFLDKQPVISLIIITIVSASVSMVIAILLERICYRPLRTAPRLVPLITAIGASFFLQYVFRGFYGSGTKGYPTIIALRGTVHLLGIDIFKSQLVVIISAIIMMLLLYGIVQWTKIGKAMRAVSEDKEAAELMGINVDRIIVFTFALGGASAGIAGILYTILFPAVNFYMGFFPGIKAFTAAVLGGIGNVAGAFLGSIILGLLESLGPNLFLTGLGIPSPSQLKDAIAFIVLVLILIFRPTGILGERIALDMELEANMKSDRSLLIKTIQNGLLGGAISLLLGVIGLVQAFGKTYVISGVVTMGQIFVVFPILFETIITTRRNPKMSTISTLLYGGLVGLLGGVILVILVLLGQVINFRSVLINVSPDLFALLTFGLPLLPGILVLLVFTALIGALGAAVLLLPPRVRNALTQAILYVVLIGLFRDLIFTVIIRWGPVQYAFLWLFAQSGLSIIGAIAVFVIVGGLAYWRSGKTKKVAVVNRTPTQQKRIKYGTYAGIVIVVLLLPVILGSYFSEILDNVGIYVLMGLGLNIVVGFAGLLDLGYVAFYAIGAYTLGVLTTPGAVGLLHLNFWAATPIAIVVAVFAGVVLGLPVLRMRGDYLAIVTLGFGEIIRILVLSDWLEPILGGPGGIVRIAQPTIGSFVFGDQMRIYYVILVGILIAGFISVRVKDSHVGRSWMALREDEDVAQAMGINKVSTKLLAFAMGALFSGFGGVLFASKIGSIYPQSFSFIVSINILSLIIIGGMGSIPGVFIGGLALVGLPLLLSQFTDFRYLIYGAALVAMMLYKPEGLSPEARRRLELHEEKVEAPHEEPATILKTPGE